MAKDNRRRLPAGIQSFKAIRAEGYLYVDKTDIIWQLVNHGDKYNYLSVLADSASLCLLIPFRLISRERKNSSRG